MPVNLAERQKIPRFLAGRHFEIRYNLTGGTADLLSHASRLGLYIPVKRQYNICLASHLKILEP
jgi:hypothetical protein